MANFIIFLKALPIIWKFWGEFKELFEMIKEFKHERDVVKFMKDVKEASAEADETGDTSGYEDIISNGRKH